MHKNYTYYVTSFLLALDTSADHTINCMRMRLLPTSKCENLRKPIRGKLHTK